MRSITIAMILAATKAPIAISIIFIMLSLSLFEPVLLLSSPVGVSLSSPVGSVPGSEVISEVVPVDAVGFELTVVPGVDAAGVDAVGFDAAGVDVAGVEVAGVEAEPSLVHTASSSK